MAPVAVSIAFCNLVIILDFVNISEAQGAMIQEVTEEVETQEEISMAVIMTIGAGKDTVPDGILVLHDLKE